MTMTYDQAGYECLAWLMDKTDGSAGSVIANALQLYREMIQLSDQGNRLAIMRADGTVEAHMVFEEE